MALPAFINPLSDLVIGTGSIKKVGKGLNNTIIIFFNDGTELKPALQYINNDQMELAFSSLRAQLLDIPTPVAPTVTTIDPVSCVAADGTTMEITGTNFVYTGSTDSSWKAYLVPTGHAPFADLAAVLAVSGTVALSSPIYNSATDSHWSVYAGELAIGHYDVVYVGPETTPQIAYLENGFEAV